MSTLTDPVLRGKKDPTQDYLKDFLITGGGEEVEQKLKDVCNWNGETPVAAVGIHIGDNKNIIQAELFVCGVKEVGRIAANTLYGDGFAAESYVKVNPVDLALASVRDRMVSDWIPSDKVDWCLKVFNPASDKFTVIQKLNSDTLKEKGGDKLNFRLHLALSPGPKVVAKLGVAPVEKVKQMIGNDSINFPMILVGKETKMELLPAEPRDAEFGLGFVPLFIYRGDKDDLELPEFIEVREAIAGLFNNSCKVKEHKKFATWKSSAVLGKWSVADPQFIWPPTAAARVEDNDEGKGAKECEYLDKIFKIQFTLKNKSGLVIY